MNSFAKPTPWARKSKEASKTIQQTQTWSRLEKRLYRHARPLLILSQILASAPAGSHRPSSASTSTKRRHLLQALHIAWCLLLCSALAAFVYTEYTERIVKLPTVQRWLYCCEYLVHLVHVLLIAVSSYRVRHKFGEFLAAFLHFDCRLLAFGAAHDYQRFLRFCCTHYSLLIIHTTSVFIIGYFHCHAHFANFLRSIVGYTLPNGILYISLLQYVGLLHGIAQRATLLNRVLRSEVSRASDGLHSSLQRLRALHSHLELFTQQVSDAFGPSVLLVFLGSFMNISVGIFLVYKYVDGAVNGDLLWTLYSLLWTCMHIAKVFFVLYHNHRVQVQKNTTALILNEIRGQSVQLEETITRFILQLHINTRNNYVCGVISLNLDFIKSLLLAVSTVFIFLLQYDETFDSLNTSE